MVNPTQKMQNFLQNQVRAGSGLGRRRGGLSEGPHPGECFTVQGLGANLGQTPFIALLKSQVTKFVREFWPAAGPALRRLRRRGRKTGRRLRRALSSLPSSALGRRRRPVAQRRQTSTTETSGGKCFLFSLKVKVFVLQASERTLSNLLSCSTQNGSSLSILQLKSKGCPAVSLDRPLHLCAKKWSDHTHQFCQVSGRQLRSSRVRKS